MLIKQVVLFLWQLPQNLLGLLVIFVTQAKYMNKGCWVTTKGRFGVSLGKYIIFGQVVNDTSFKHEQGHQKQSLYLGWLYLLVIGLPSVTGNILNRFIDFDYYSQPWEAWADRLENIIR